MSSAENLEFSRKDWPLWFLVYLILSLSFNLVWGVWTWKNFFLLSSIFIFAVAGLCLAKKYVGCQKFIARCTFLTIVIVFLAAPVWVEMLGGSMTLVARMDWRDYVENIVITFLLAQYFIGSFYALLLLPFLWFLTKYRYKEYSGGEKRNLRILDVIYWIFMMIWPVIVIAFLFDPHSWR